MLNAFGLKQSIDCSISRNRKILEDFLLKGKYKIEHYDLFGNLVGEYSVFNGIVNEGKNYALNAMFNGGTQISSWFIGLINNSGFSSLNASDTMGSHGGWLEWTDYTQTTRVAWGSATTSNQLVTNATPAQFDVNANGTLYGIFVTSSNVKGGNTGTLWSTGGFTTPPPVSNGDQLKITYSCGA